LEASGRQRDKLLVEAIKSDDPGRRVLQVIADSPIPKPNLDNFNIKSAEDALTDMDKRNEAKEALKQMDQSQRPPAKPEA
jgi:hypothetical protein